MIETNIELLELSLKYIKAKEEIINFYKTGQHPSSDALIFLEENKNLEKKLDHFIKLNKVVIAYD